ncbi:hypothetical protein N4T77_15965 [Clostridium sp. CX1]|uniref:Uncharacterized protein n=1 Tax=Clostridium tanneri TaxID=3037988 RepID=A0ABU4JSK4_9CLOT|nr:MULTISPECIES: hypothetical protein [unclassified Clostridium]MCT8978087.1 hypothetical protein [Clostridium sp. CX1]MDW8800939.1 hypothetical protein [Clostridium sp. A1-XYC3]
MSSSNEIVRIYDSIISFFQTIGYPTIDLAFQLIRIRKPLFDYLKYYKSS